jgi:serine/threonine-protein kinase
MAPEQLVRPNEVDERADVWSLGVTLYELLVGKSPFRGPTDEYVARAVMVEYPFPPSMAKPDIPEALSAVVMRCLEKDKRARFASAAELGAAIEKVMLQARASVSPPPLMPTLHSVPPPPMPAATIPPPEPILEPPKKGIAGKLAVGFFVMAVLSAAAVWIVLHDRQPQHVVAASSASASATSTGTSTSTATTLATVPATEPTLSSIAPLKNSSSVTDTKPGKAPDPMCYAANIVCKRSYPECQSLKDYCEGKHEAADSGAPLPGESPVCTAARIVCDNKLEECESLTKKCLIAQQQPNP